MTDATSASDPRPASGGETGSPIARLLIVLGVTWVVTGTILGGFSTFQFLDPTEVGRHILDGAIPYRDFPLEYPPGGAAILTVPALFGSSAFEVVFRILMASLWGALFALVWRWDRPAVGPFLLASASLAWVIGGGFDIAVALAVYLGFHALRRGRAARASTALSIGVAIKLTPGALLPFAWRASPKHQRASAAAIAVLAIIVSVALPFLIARGDGDPIRFHGDRALHAESTIGSAIVVARIATNDPYPVVVQDNARAVAAAGRAPVWIALAMLSVALGVLWVRGLPLAPAAWTAALLAIPALGPLASPQFLLWPLGVLALAPRRVLVGFVVAAALSGMMFSGPFEPSEGTALALLTLIRNLALVAAFVAAAAAALRTNAAQVQA